MLAIVSDTPRALNSHDSSRNKGKRTNLTVTLYFGVEYRLNEGVSIRQLDSLDFLGLR